MTRAPESPGAQAPGAAARLLAWAAARRSTLAAVFTLAMIGARRLRAGAAGLRGELRRRGRGARRHRPAWRLARGAGADGGELRDADALRLQRLRRDRPAAALAADRTRRGRRLRGGADRGLRAAERRRDPDALLHPARDHAGRHRPGRRLRHHRLRRRARGHRRARRALARRATLAGARQVATGWIVAAALRDARRRRRSCSRRAAGASSRRSSAGGRSTLPGRGSCCARSR